MSKFQIVLLGFFGFFILLAVLVFALYRGSTSSGATLSAWGSIPSSDFALFLSEAGLNQGDLSVRYKEIPAEELQEEFTEALARGNGPDLLIFQEDQFWQARSKLVPIPYQSISERQFKEAFVQASEIFLLPEGIYALPLAVDPLVLYYNRDLLSAEGFAKPLSYWDELYAETLKLTRRDGAGNITQSTIALGDTRNIDNAKDILSLLMMQAGTPITGFVGPDLRPLFSYNPGLPSTPAESALDFYTQFSNPAKPYYSWNRNLPEARTYFTSSDAAYYLGFASELPTVRSKSPTLNFAVASVPQSRVSGKTITLGRVHAVGITRGAKNPGAAFQAAGRLAARESAEKLSPILGLPPARRDLLSAKPTDSYMPVFYEAALQARSWIDPDSARTRALWREAIDAVTSGRSRTSEAVNEANKKLETLIKK